MTCPASEAAGSDSARLCCVSLSSPKSPVTQALGSTADLLTAARSGDEQAVRRLVELYRPLLERWARGRLPGNARGLVETSDLVQVAMVRALNRIDQIDARRPGAFLAYLRRTLLNQLRNEIRNASRRPASAASMDEEGRESEASLPASPLVVELGSELIERYDAALSGLPETQQIAVILRVEFGCGHGEIAEAIGSPSANAARMVVSRALVRLAKKMDENTTD